MIVGHKPVTIGWMTATPLIDFMKAVSERIG
jgi:hypothetical protein